MEEVIIKGLIDLDIISDEAYSLLPLIECDQRSTVEEEATPMNSAFINLELEKLHFKREQLAWQRENEEIDRQLARQEKESERTS